jgi:hypothetical protein
MSASRPLKSALIVKENSKDKNFVNVPESVRKALNQAARNEANAKEIAAEFERQQKGQPEQVASEQSENDSYKQNMKEVFEQMERQGKQQQALAQEMEYQSKLGNEFAGFSFNDDVPSTPMPGGRRKSRKYRKHSKHRKTSKKTRRFRKIRVL